MNTKRRLAEARARLRQVRAELRETRKNPPPRPDLFSEMRRAVIEGMSADSKANARPIDIRRASPITGPMPAGTPTVNAIAEAYQVSRQRLHDMRRKYYLSPADFQRPDLVLAVLLERAPASPMRSRLTDPAERLRIHQILNS